MIVECAISSLVKEMLVIQKSLWIPYTMKGIVCYAVDRHLADVLFEHAVTVTMENQIYASMLCIANILLELK